MAVSTLASFEYLEQLSGTTFQKLYRQPSTALAIFRRMLPHLGRASFAKKSNATGSLVPGLLLTLRRQRDEALSLLSRLYIVHITARTRDDPQVVSLTKGFRSSLQLALTGGGNHQSFGVPSSDSATADVDLHYLDEYARAQWEGILHYVVSSVGEGMHQASQGPTSAVKQLLKAGSLVTSGAHSGITQAGFSFLLQEVNAQVWTLLLLWIKNAEQMEMDSVDVLSFLFMLGSLELGRAYSTTTLSESQRQMLKYLVDFGLVYIPRSTPNQFFPTRLSTTLTSDATALRSVAAGFDAVNTSATGTKGFIIIETNYRLYAYTTSPLQIAVLALFTKLTTRYPNMVAGRITRESIYRAISHGITSDQVISYLSTHAHPQLLKSSAAHGGGPVLPPTVVDQIRLWQIENERMKATSGFLFKEFESQKEYDACVKYADAIGVLVWKSDPKRMFFVSRVEQLRDYLKSRKTK
ncbi:General transcription and DNA repair factor IIH subunit tfb2 [Lachnellula suecica]|uniref:RNA polymerase II transcription factor B subunit 2 n=1 Tax=Lachnellula suecica TaxID=602035 RepID=A0A8T9C2S8_9HELO|nr:General transcription and DNA repair factor IIH subunit tfb2 [Lachnellula suecica]